MSLKQFLTSKQFLKNIGLAILISIVLAWISLFFLSIYTNRGEGFATPDFSGKNFTEAEAITENVDVRVVVQDSVYRKDVLPGVVLKQTPLAGHKVKPGRMVYLTISSISPEQVEVPKLTDVSMRHARALLESKGFALGQIEFRPSEFDDLVLDARYANTTILPGSKLDNGATIDLVVGRNLSDGETLVPDLTGLTLEGAKAILAGKTLYAGMMLFNPPALTTEDSLNAKIYKQFPVADSTTVIPIGTSIDLWLGEETDQPEQ